ncbi:MAG: hypothetical protein LBK42_01060 [Propionibacteriaceae bacterium]|nr:hypothetical protein [Propionibacteriaceae bacterium]
MAGQPSGPDAQALFGGQAGFGPLLAAGYCLGYALVGFGPAPVIRDRRGRRVRV